MDGRCATVERWIPRGFLPIVSRVRAAIVLLACIALGCGSEAPPSDPVGSKDAATPSEDSALPSEDSGTPNVTVPVDAGPDPTFDSAIYTSAKQKFTVGKIGDAIDAVLVARPATDHVILFVHGRACGGGGEPDKSLAGSVPELEQAKGASVLLFYWPGSDDACPAGFPESRALDAGPALRFALARVQTWAQGHASTKAKLGFSLLTHSMGNIVLESALSPGTTGLSSSLFGTAILNSSATALAKHAPWLAKLDFATQVYVTVNDGDKVLLAAGLGRGTRLGKALDAEPLTSRAAYVDFSAAGVNHQYYVPSGQKGVHLGDFYGAVLAGKPYPLSTSTAITSTKSRDGATIWVFDGK